MPATLWLRRVARVRRGFTLVEVLVALAVVVLIASVVLPRLFDRLSGRVLDQAVRAVEDGLSETRARAVETGRPWRLELRARNRGWVLWQVEIGGEAEAVSDDGAFDERATFGAGFVGTGDGLDDVGGFGLQDGEAERLIGAMPAGLLAPDDGTSVEPIVLATVLSDGSVLAGSDLQLSEEPEDGPGSGGPVPPGDAEGLSRVGESRPDAAAFSEPDLFEVILKIEPVSGRVYLEQSGGGIADDLDDFEGEADRESLLDELGQEPDFGGLFGDDPEPSPRGDDAGPGHEAAGGGDRDERRGRGSRGDRP